MRHIITLGSVPVEIVSKHKILGVTFSSDLTWTCHIEALTKSLSSAAGALARCRHYFPIKAKIQIYHALFATHLHYCTLVWGTTTLGNVERLFLLQKKALRYIANIPYSHSTQSLFSRYRIMSVKNIYEFRLLYSFFFSNEKFRAFLEYMCDLGLQRSDSRTRGCDRWLVPLRRTGYFLQSLRCTVPSLLNKHENLNTNLSDCTRKEMRELFLNPS